MILVTGAGGKTGKAVVRALTAAGAQVRAFVQNTDHEPALRERGAQEVIAGDLRSATDLRHAAEGVRAVYHICPNVHPDELSIGQAAIAAAREAGVEHFVFHSVLHPQTEAMPHHWHKLHVEEAVFASGLPFTILQPAPYMQNILAGWAAIVGHGVYVVPYPVATRLSMVDLEDVAQAAAAVLTEPGHLSATYELVGTPPMSQTEVAAVLAEQLGRPVAAVSESVDTWAQRARAGATIQLGWIGRGPNRGDAQISTLGRMFDYYARYGLPGNPNVLKWLLARQPMTFREFVARVATVERP